MNSGMSGVGVQPRIRNLGITAGCAGARREGMVRAEGDAERNECAAWPIRSCEGGFVVLFCETAAIAVAVQAI